MELYKGKDKKKYISENRVRLIERWGGANVPGPAQEWLSTPMQTAIHKAKGRGDLKRKDTVINGRVHKKLEAMGYERAVLISQQFRTRQTSQLLSPMGEHGMGGAREKKLKVCCSLLFLLKNAKGATMARKTGGRS